jgi:hypothetical protein
MDIHHDNMVTFVADTVNDGAAPASGVAAAIVAVKTIDKRKALGQWIPMAGPLGWWEISFPGHTLCAEPAAGASRQPTAYASTAIRKS